MKIAFLSSIYPDHLELIYTKNKFLKRKTYAEQKKIVDRKTICSMSKWPKLLNDIGHESIMLIRNNSYMQEMWSKENEFHDNSGDYEFNILNEQVKRFQPDILFIFGASYYDQNNRLDRITNNCTSIKKKICWYGAPEGNENIFVQYDLVLTNSISLRDSIRKKGGKSEKLDHAFEPEIINAIQKKPKINKICFIGSLIPGNEWHNKRINYLESLAENFDVQIYSNVNRLSHKNKLLKKTFEIRQRASSFIAKYTSSDSIFQNYANPDNLPKFSFLDNSPINKIIKRPVYGIDMLQKLSEYRVTFNMHIAQTGNYACNIRLLEATGVGTCLITDKKTGNGSFLSRFNNFCSYDSKEDLITKTDHLMSNHRLTDQISEELQQQTISKHNTKNQFDRLNNYLKLII
jgi:spore maturation protein CgeB